MDRFSKNKLTKKERKIAYFSMEIGLDEKIPTYSGGLGILAGDSIKSCADLNVPLVAITLLYRKGYFLQKLNEQGIQTEEPVIWEPEKQLNKLNKKIYVTIEGREVAVTAWKYKVTGVNKFQVPVIFLDTDLEENAENDRHITDYLYGGDHKYRLCQEIILGIGGIRILDKLGYSNIKKYHMNEGHSSLLILELLRKKRVKHTGNKLREAVRNKCVFTTHTPVPAGHDTFSEDLVRSVVGEIIPFDEMKPLFHDGALNLTYLALDYSKHINGVAKKHGEISRQMFPGYMIDSITNGVHSATWTSKHFKELYDRFIPGWQKDPFTLRYALNIPKQKIWETHENAKKDLIDFVNQKTNVGMDPDVFTIVFARRSATYKRADLLFTDIKKLIDISKNVGAFQIIYAGKAHPNDQPGKDIIKNIFLKVTDLKDSIKVVYIENYNMETAKILVAGGDLWLNTPLRPLEASGTSGMKACHNGVPSLSVLDGWWLEGHVENVTGWSIGCRNPKENTNHEDSDDMYKKLENIIFKYYNDSKEWRNIMKHAIAFNASFFNTHRMVEQYVLNAYFD
ncbi:MAG: alpha-glucan family phosphorylase [DPANN group archaeon]|nr:alpha-glucan family phosphorylase [DPANN group archaeon]